MTIAESEGQAAYGVSQGRIDGTISGGAAAVLKKKALAGSETVRLIVRKGERRVNMKSDLEQQSSKEIFRKNFVTRVQSLYGKSIDEALPSEKIYGLGHGGPGLH